MSVRLRKLSIISDFITGTVGLKTILFIVVNPYTRRRREAKKKIFRRSEELVNRSNE